MKLARVVFVSALLVLLSASPAHADDSTPVTAPPAAAATAVDSGPPSQDSTPIPVATDVPDVPTSVSVAPERSKPISRVENPGAGQPETGPATQQTAVTDTGPAGPQRPGPGAPVPAGQQVATPAPKPPSAGIPADTSSTDVTLPTGPPGSASAAAPAQLACRGKDKPVSGPFLVAPYSGWTEVMSYVDHDSPDYSVDGKIVLANGLTALESDGQESDVFPAYWSPRMRQYINYDGHNGYDFDISYQPVLAAADGTIMFAGWNGDSEYAGYGLMVLINHHNGYVTLYGHLSQLEVKKGDRVSAGQEIGISGSTGHSTGPHLHFSVFHNCNVTDPYGWTGKGTDPLAGFDGEKSAYLWLPGHDPLVLNAPPGWPVYPLGLHVALPRELKRLGPRATPPADRLLLLALPAPQPGMTASAGVALARTEAAITAEGEALAPQLESLKATGAIENYQLIPAAAAVWVRGNASAAELETLPGVASLSGVKPRDLVAAQAGLAHSVLVQFGAGQAPSLWPVGFRSALHAWRPVMTVVNGHSLVAGYGLPGRTAVLTLLRGHSIAAVATATADSQTGGFAAMLHDESGEPVPTQAGDVVQATVAGKSLSMTVLGTRLSARLNRVEASVPAGSTVSISILAPGAERPARRLSTAGAGGVIHIRPASPLVAGTLVIASLVDAAGNEEAAAGYVPGVEAVEGSPTVRGWTVGRAPRLAILRHGRILYEKSVNRAPDGTFLAQITSGRQTVPLQAGDVVTLGSRAHAHTLQLPRLAAHLALGDRHVAVTGPAGADLQVYFARASGERWSTSVHLPATGTEAIELPWKAADAGDILMALCQTARGDWVGVRAALSSVVLREGSSIVTGQVPPGSTVSVSVQRGTGPVASGIAQADSDSGRFSVNVASAGGPAVLRRDAVADIHEGSAVESVKLPVIAMQSAGRVVEVTAAPHVAVSFASDTGTSHILRTIRTDGEGHAAVRLSSLHVFGSRVIVRVRLTPQVTAERVLVLAPCRASVRGSAHREVRTARC